MIGIVMVIMSLVCVIVGLFKVKTWKFNISGLLIWVFVDIVWFVDMINATPGSFYRSVCILIVILSTVLVIRLLRKRKG